MFNKLSQKEWVNISKALANTNRFKILRMLWGGEEKHVTEIAELLKISVKATSRNLVLLERQKILECLGKQNRVYYRITHDMSVTLKDMLSLILSRTS